MSNKIITDLTRYTADEISGSIDLFYITDMTLLETKAITVLELAEYTSKALGVFTGSFTGSLIGNVTGDLTGTASWAQNAVSASYAPSAGGEINTASSTGSYGYGLVSDKVGVDLRFKKIGQGSNITIAPDVLDPNVMVISAATTTTAGGSIGNIQFKSPAGTFAGNDNLSWNTTDNNKLIVIGTIASTYFSSSVVNDIGFIGTSSCTISASRSISSSASISSSYSFSGSFATTSSYSLRQDLGISSHTSTNTVDTYKGSKYTFTHLLGSTPKYFRCVLICTVNDTVAGYSQYTANDEIDATAVYDSSGDNEHTAITTWSNTSFLGASLLNNGYLINNKDTGDNSVLDLTKWKIKFYYA